MAHCGLPQGCPTEMERFEHQHLEPDTIRLFRLDADSTPGDMHLTIQHHPDYADGDVNYVALSYCWGDPTPVADVRLNGQALGIAQNLLDCLKVQHDCSRDTWYWVDAICINQKDVEERNQQVPQMWRIYSAAQYVLSWLGLADDEMARAFEIGNVLVAKYGSDVQSQPEPEDITQPPGSYEAAATLFAAEYFRRMWITPETMNARQILLKAGSSSLPWSALYLLPDKSPDQGWENFPWGRLMKDRMSPFMGLMGGPPEELAGVNVLCNALRSNFNKRCSDVRDKIFSLTANPHLRIRQCDRWLKADYRMLPEEVCVMTLAYWDQLATKYKNGAQIDMELLGSLSDGPGTHDGSPRDQAKPRRQEPNDGASLLNSAFERESLERDSRDVLRDTLQTLGLEASAFQVWLRKSVRADCIYTAAGLALDCAGPILQDVLGSGVLISQKANWPAVYHTQRQYNLRLRGFDNLVPVITRSPISQMGAKTVRKTIKMMTRALKTPGRPTPESADQIITPSSTKRKRDTSDIPVEPPVLADFDDDDLAFLRVLFARVQAKISHRKKASEAAGLEGKMEQGGAGSSTVSKTPLEASSAAQPRHREWPEAQSANVANDEDQQKPRKKRRRLNGDADPGQ